MAEKYSAARSTIHDCAQGQVSESAVERLVHEVSNYVILNVRVVEDVLAHSLEAVLAVNPEYFVVATQQEKSVGIGQLVCEQETEDFDWLRASVHVIAKKDKSVVGVLGIDDKMLVDVVDVVEIAVQVSKNDHFVCRNLNYQWLVTQQIVHLATH